MTNLVNAYDSRLYHLDLCILSYHLYHQSLIWPMDPYYECLATKDPTSQGRRNNFMSKTVETLSRNNGSYNGPFRGPGTWSGKSTNTNLDPIITDYTRVNPWIPSFIQSETNTWDYLSPSSFITEKIKEIYIYQKNYDTKKAEFNILRFATNGPAASKTDTLCCFEGGTGAVNYQTPTSPAFSLMGFVLARSRDGLGEQSLGYDIHIAFRGSRSGSAARALAQGLFSKSGNPDWVTDMDFNRLFFQNYSTGGVETVFSKTGGISEGFALSMDVTFNNIIACLSEIKKMKGNQPPKNIYVTGHSLGGALAAMCASALSNPENIPDELKEFPFDQLNLITYSAPTVGNREFANSFNSRVNAHRIFIDGDPVTSSKLDSYGVHVGARTCLPKFPGQSRAGTDAHEPINVRKQLLAMLKQEGVEPPSSAVSVMQQYSSLKDLLTELKKLINADLIVKEDIKNFLKDYEANLEGYMKVYATLGKTQNECVAINTFNDITFKANLGIYSGSAIVSIPEVLIRITSDNSFRIFLGQFLVLKFMSVGASIKELEAMPAINGLINGQLNALSNK